MIGFSLLLIGFVLLGILVLLLIFGGKLARLGVLLLIVIAVPAAFLTGLIDVNGSGTNEDPAVAAKAADSVMRFMAKGRGRGIPGVNDLITHAKGQEHLERIDAEFKLFAYDNIRNAVVYVTKIENDGFHFSYQRHSSPDGGHSIESIGVGLPHQIRVLSVEFEDDLLVFEYRAEGKDVERLLGVQPDVNYKIRVPENQVMKNKADFIKIWAEGEALQ